MLWEIQRRYFEQAGIDAWRDDVVPHAISCSPYMARAYAQVICGYLHDLLAADQVTADAPLYIIELGAGSGRLSYHLFHQLERALALPAFAALDVRIVLTDFAQATVDFWRSQPNLAALADDGWIDFALFDAMNPQQLHLLHADVVLTSAEICNPIICLANYFFDSIPQDSFAIADGFALPNLLTLLSSQHEPNLSDPQLWERLSLDYEALPIEHVYSDPLYNEILDYYAATLPNTHLTFPNKGLDCLRWLIDYANGALLLLSADRGHTLLESLVDQPPPLPNLHGSFSLMVNYHAIGVYTVLRNGLAFQPPHYQNNLQVGAFCFGDGLSEMPATQEAYARDIWHRGPDDFFALRDLALYSAERSTLPQLLSILRLSAYDADLLQQVLPRLQHLAATESAVWHPDIADVVARTLAQYLPLSDDDLLLIQAAKLLDALELGGENG